MEWRVRNAAGTTICTRRATLVSGGIVRYHFNIFGAYIECVQTDPSAAETLQAYILDQTPDLQTDSTNYVVGGGRRNNAGTDDATGNICGHLYALDNGAAAHVAGRTPGPRQAGTTAMNYTNAQVSWLFRDAMIFINQAGSLKWTGRIYHALLCDATIPPQAERSINIDTATTGVFKVTGQPLIQTTQKIMMRKS
jgi:hypothetical protein